MKIKVFLVVLLCCVLNHSEGRGNGGGGGSGGGNDTDRCSLCEGEEYECIRGRCYCADGYIPTPLQTACIQCPGLGDPCFGRCCRADENLQCWQGLCQYCYDPNGTWICQDAIDQILLVSVTQIAMATALVLGIIATFILLYKLCAVTSMRSSNNPFDTGRLSVGSLQMYVDERLRDAPPRYSRAAPSTDSSLAPGAYFINAGFIHDSSVPPPPYAEKIENNQVTAHI